MEILFYKKKFQIFDAHSHSIAALIKRIMHVLFSKLTIRYADDCKYKVYLNQVTPRAPHHMAFGIWGQNWLPVKRQNKSSRWRPPKKDRYNIPKTNGYRSSFQDCKRNPEWRDTSAKGFFKPNKYLLAYMNALYVNLWMKATQMKILFFTIKYVVQHVLE